MRFIQKRLRWGRSEQKGTDQLHSLEPVMPQTAAHDNDNAKSPVCNVLCCFILIYIVSPLGLLAVLSPHTQK